MELVDPWHVESVQIKDKTHVPCTGSWILNQWTAREVLYIFYLYQWWNPFFWRCGFPKYLGISITHCIIVTSNYYHHQAKCVKSYETTITPDYFIQWNIQFLKLKEKVNFKRIELKCSWVFFRNFLLPEQCLKPCFKYFLKKENAYYYNSYKMRVKPKLYPYFGK